MRRLERRTLRRPGRFERSAWSAVIVAAVSETLGEVGCAKLRVREVSCGRQDREDRTGGATWALGTTEGGRCREREDRVECLRMHSDRMAAAAGLGSGKAMERVFRPGALGGAWESRNMNRTKSSVEDLL